MKTYYADKNKQHNKNSTSFHIHIVGLIIPQIFRKNTTLFLYISYSKLKILPLQ